MAMALSNNFSGPSDISTQEQEQANQNRFYSRNIELSVAIRELDREYYIGPKDWLSYHTSVTGQYVTTYWKPPGALMWVEKWSTERLSGNNLEFVTKGYFDTEDHDLLSTQLRFEVYGSREDSRCRWSFIETNLERVVGSGAKGLQLSLPLDISNIPEYLKHIQDDIVPGFIHLRAEYVNSLAMDNLGVKILLAALVQKNCRTIRPKYILEVHKVNDDNCLEMSNPYTIIYRDEVFDKSELKEFDAKTLYSSESRITNGDMDRVLKIILCKRKSGEKKGFVMFTINELLKNQLQFLSFTGLDGKLMKLSVRINLSQLVNLKIFPDFIELGLKFISVYAVNYSQSNWDTSIHGKSLHEPNESGITPYEEAMELIATAMDLLSSDNTDKFKGESVFYGFADESTILVTTFENDKHFKRLIGIYHDTLWSVLFKSMSLRDDDDEVSDNFTECGGGYREEGDQQRPGTSTSTTTQNTTFSCVPQSCKLKGHPFVLKCKSLMVPLLEDIDALLCTRPQHSLEYFVVFILTDGEFTDLEQSVDMLSRLALKPVSVIFVGVGSGDFTSLLKLSNCWTGTLTGKPFRQNLLLIHFRSSQQWLSSLIYYKVRSKAQDIFVKEILTALRDQSVAYLRLHHPEI